MCLTTVLPGTVTIFVVSVLDVAILYEKTVIGMTVGDLTVTQLSGAR